MTGRVFQLSAGSTHSIRVAVADLRWPLDPAFAATRDETTIARAVYATPLRTDEAGRVVPGLCTGWNASPDFRTWRFEGCRAAPAIAAEVRRVEGLRASPAHWIFAAVQQVAAPAPGTVVVRLRSPWRRFPYALTTVAAAPLGVRGAFRVVGVRPGRLTLRGGGVTLVFRRLSGFPALRAFRRGEVDEAPVPLGDVGRFRPDRFELRVRRLLAQDLVVFRAGAVPGDLRRAYWQTADRADYQALVAENAATAALGVAGPPATFDPAAFRRALDEIPSLPPRPVRLAVDDDPALRYGAGILWARWRQLGLAPRLVPQAARSDAELRRVVAFYPQDEALLGGLGLSAELGQVDQAAGFGRVDAQLRRDASIVPICWVVDARLVSRSLYGWREDVLGDVDYTRVFVRRR